MKPMHMIQAAILAAAICGASPASAGISTVPGTRDIIPIRKELVAGERTAASDLQKKSVVLDEERAYHHAVDRDRPKVEKLLMEQRSVPKCMFQTPWFAKAIYFLR